ncbi:DUF6328 family protein [Kutzneria sp. CA-103260]|uniref:DUF6328 family protein n=1 Tax=Kutzneria sp. CA-103260 TaxID=2802641 RepID=UPI001BF10045|nr:DUF6328 family protein [Kutzneria sp. CA-103260]QUQ67330.1 integral membrane protein [Kutzneria sp. CA-103260]
MAPEETEPERLARNLAELLQELRVAQNGVQVLFGFLLTLAFTDRYANAGHLVHVTHVVTTSLAAGSAAFLIAPAAWHRILFRHGHREQIIRTASVSALVGLILLAAAMTGTVLMIGYMVFGALLGALLSAGFGLLFLTLWFILPLWMRIAPR